MPAKLADIVRAAKAHGLSVEKPKSGSHWKVKSGSKSYPIPAHNALKSQISDVYIAGLCRCFAIDLDTFKKSL